MRPDEGETDPARAGALRRWQEERFGAYFPRVFAYACSVAGNDEAAQDIVVTAFARTFAVPGLQEPEFELALFKAARDEADHSPRHNDGLTIAERDVIALVFDAQLRHSQVAEVMGESEAAVSITLARGLRKLQSRFAPGPAPRAGVPSYR